MDVQVSGSDVYIVDDVGDVVTELIGGGSDEVRTGLSSYSLSANVETLTYTGSGNFTGVGNASDNLIQGDVGNDTLSGVCRQRHAGWWSRERCPHGNGWQ